MEDYKKKFARYRKSETNFKKKFRVYHLSNVGKDFKVRSLCGRLRNEHKPTQIGLLGNWVTAIGLKVNCMKCIGIGWSIGLLPLPDEEVNIATVQKISETQAG